MNEKYIIECIIISDKKNETLLNKGVPLIIARGKLALTPNELFSILLLK